MLEIVRPCLRQSTQSASSHQRAEEMLRLVLDTIPQYIFWKDRESVYLGCNRNFARVAGVDPPEAIIGETDFELPWRRGEAEFFRTVDQRVMANDRAEVHIIEPQRQADGRHAWLDTSKVPIHDEHGSVVGILGAFEDITARIRREREQETLLTVARALRTASNRSALVTRC
jgi:PAS domain S-box-containing protein